VHLRIAPFATSGRLQRRPESGTARLRRRWATLGSAYRRLGLPGAAVALSKLVPGRAPVAEWVALFETSRPAAGAEPRDATVRWGGRDDADLLSALDRPREELERRLDAGDRLCIALRGDEPVGAFWLRADRWREHDVDFAIPRGARWGYDAYVAPHARGQGVHPLMASWAVEQLAREGVSRYISGIDYVNAPSLRSAARRGARPLGSIVVLRALGLALLRERWGEGRPAWRVYRRSRGTVVTIPAAGGAGG
jgi:GNAT superfamily N-acetyltransferase